MIAIGLLALGSLAVVPQVSADCSSITIGTKIEQCTDGSGSNNYTIDGLVGVGTYCSGNPYFYDEHECMTGVSVKGTQAGLQEGPGSKLCVRVGSLCIGEVG